MMTDERLRTALYWLLVLQCCVISVSIAAASISLALTIFLLVFLSVKARRWIIPHTPLDIAFLAYIAVEFITAFNSVNQPDALKNAKRLLLIAIVYAAVAAFDNREKIERGVRIIAGMVALLSLAEVVLFVQGGSDRLYIFQHYMTTGGLKMIVALAIIPFILSPETDKKIRLFFSVSFVPIIAALLLTNTRSAWLGFVAGMVVMSGLYYRKLFALLVAIILLFFLAAPQNQIERAKSIVDPTHPNNVGRLTMWSTGLKMWSDKPILGFGDIDLFESYSQYRTPGIAEPAGHLHNNYIHLLVTLGAAGLAVVLGLFALIAAAEYKIFSQFRADPLVRNCALGGIAIFAGFLVNGMFEWNFGDHEIMVFIWFSVGLVLAAGNIAKT